MLEMIISMACRPVKRIAQHIDFSHSFHTTCCIISEKADNLYFFILSISMESGYRGSASQPAFYTVSFSSCLRSQIDAA